VGVAQAGQRLPLEPCARTVLMVLVAILADGVGQRKAAFEPIGAVPLGQAENALGTAERPRRRSLSSASTNLAHAPVSAVCLAKNGGKVREDLLSH
jgi:hypothetical protein